MPTEKKHKPTVGGLFSGVGGIELGFKNAGFKPVWANDIDRYAYSTYAANFNPQRYFLMDIDQFIETKLDWLPSVDVLTAGFPCQAFSLAGNRKGFKDPRGNLFLKIIKALKKLENKPKVIFLENVKNFATHDNGNTWKKVKDLLEKQNYSVTRIILNTSEYTVIPQNRERTYIICLNNQPNICSNKLSDMQQLQQLLPPPKPLLYQYRHFRDYLENSIEEKYFYDSFYENKILNQTVREYDYVYQWRRVYVRKNKKGNVPTLTANMGTGGHNVPIILDNKRKRKLTPKECFNFQGFPSNFLIPKSQPNSQLYKQAGNSVTVPLITKLAKIIKIATNL